MIAIRNKEEFEKMSVEELILEQQTIMKSIMEFENKHILHNDNENENKPFEPSMIICPSPSVVWRVISEELIIITKLLDEKTRDENGIGIDYY